MKNYFVVTLLLSISYNLAAQKQKHILLGTETAGTVIKIYEQDTIAASREAYLSHAPYLGYFITNELAVGITGEYDFTSVNGKKVDEFYGYGLFVKGIIPLFPNKETVLNRIHIPVESAFLITDNYFSGGERMREDKQKLVKLSGGISFRLWKGFFVEASYSPRFYINKGFNYDGKFAVEYHF